MPTAMIDATRTDPLSTPFEKKGRNKKTGVMRADDKRIKQKMLYISCVMLFESQRHYIIEIIHKISTIPFR